MLGLLLEGCPEHQRLRPMLDHLLAQEARQAFHRGSPEEPVSLPLPPLSLSLSVNHIKRGFYKVGLAVKCWDRVPAAAAGV